MITEGFWSVLTGDTLSLSRRSLALTLSELEGKLTEIMILSPDAYTDLSSGSGTLDVLVLLGFSFCFPDPFLDFFFTDLLLDLEDGLLRVLDLSLFLSFFLEGDLERERFLFDFVLSFLLLLLLDRDTERLVFFLFLDFSSDLTLFFIFSAKGSFFLRTIFLLPDFLVFPFLALDFLLFLDLDLELELELDDLELDELELKLNEEEEEDDVDLRLDLLLFLLPLERDRLRPPFRFLD